jgi:hypothetical protein
MKFIQSIDSRETSFVESIDNTTSSVANGANRCAKVRYRIGRLRFLIVAMETLLYQSGW